MRRISYMVLTSLECERCLRRYRGPNETPSARRRARPVRGRQSVGARAMSAGAAAAPLASMLNARVHLITNDGRHVVGTLRGFDQVTNVILEDCSERVYSSESGVEEAPLGLYMIRGDNVALVGPVDEELDAGLDLAGTRAAPLKPIKF